MPQDMDYTHRLMDINKPVAPAPLAEGVEEIEWRFVDRERKRERVVAVDNKSTPHLIL